MESARGGSYSVDPVGPNRTNLYDPGDVIAPNRSQEGYVPHGSCQVALNAPNTCDTCRTWAKQTPLEIARACVFSLQAFLPAFSEPRQPAV